MGGTLLKSVGSKESFFLALAAGTGWRVPESWRTVWRSGSEKNFHFCRKGESRGVPLFRYASQNSVAFGCNLVSHGWTKIFSRSSCLQQGISTTPGILSLTSERLNVAHNRCQVSVRKGHSFGNFSPGWWNHWLKGRESLGRGKGQSILVCSGEETRSTSGSGCLACDGISTPFLGGIACVSSSTKPHLFLSASWIPCLWHVYVCFSLCYSTSHPWATRNASTWWTPWYLDWRAAKWALRKRWVPTPMPVGERELCWGSPFRGLSCAHRTGNY